MGEHQVPPHRQPGGSKLFPESPHLFQGKVERRPPPIVAIRGLWETPFEGHAKNNYITKTQEVFLYFG